MPLGKLPWERIASFAIDQLLKRIGRTGKARTTLQKAREAFVEAKHAGDIKDTPRTRLLERCLMLAVLNEIRPAKAGDQDSHKLKS